MFSSPRCKKSETPDSIQGIGPSLGLIGFVGLIHLGSMTTPSLAGETSSIEKGRTSVVRQEDQVLIRARNALSRFPALKPKNLFIRIHDGVASIDGEVASQENAREVVQLLRQVQGIYEVKSNLTVQIVKEPLIRLPGTPEAPTRTESSSLDTHTGRLGTLAGRVPDPLPPSITLGQNKTPIPVKRHPPANPFPPQKNEDVFPEFQPVKSSSRNGVLLGVPQPNQDAMSLLQDAVHQIVQDESRYQNLKIKVLDAQTILVEDRQDQSDDVTALVSRLRRLPGVRSVTVQIIN